MGRSTTERGLVLSTLSKSNLSVQVNVHDVCVGPDESNNVLDIQSIDNPAAFRAFFIEVKDRRKEKVTLTIDNDGYITTNSKEWTQCLREFVRLT